MRISNWRSDVCSSDLLLIHRAAANAGHGLPDPQEAAIAKCFANEITRAVTADAMQLMGGYGYAREYGMARKLRDSYGWGIAGGAIAIQKVNTASGLFGRAFSQRGGGPADARPPPRP